MPDDLELAGNMSPEDDYSDKYWTQDLYFAACLMHEGIELIKVFRQRGQNLAHFVMNDQDRCKKLRTDWMNSKVQVNARRFAEIIIDLKKECHKS